MKAPPPAPSLYYPTMTMLLAPRDEHGGGALQAELDRTRDELHRTQVMLMQVRHKA